MTQPISITAISSISALGTSNEEVWANYKKAIHLFERRKFDENQEWVAPLNTNAKKEIEQLRNSDSKYKKLDDSVLFAIYVSRNAIKNANWKNENFGINIGSSRGATALFESYHSEYVKNKKAATLTSPTTTLGNISSWVAHDLNSQGPEISHSITCSTALHAMINGIAWLQSGMAETFLVGGSEAPLTPFTIAQMRALKIYASPKLSLRAESRSDSLENYPCQALNLDKKQNTMVLGEGAAVACLEKGNPKSALAQIIGVGYATEILKHNISISSDAECFQRSMQMALGEVDSDEVDTIVMHAPGTIKGDLSEYKAIQKVFGDNHPALTSNKWQVGHTFGASGMLSVELAILMLKYQEFIGVIYNEQPPELNRIRKVMVNAVGFGGNAVSILLSKT
ncbi:beta-ketoacyl synthase [Maribacter algarum]|uniref:Beta-ketoacyl synthase n=1 Tax=Maribacter algarum (ex Zhang et al. 2020) TaxID=2578118 RepID=A0A5S3PWL3_9FLAO|nr:beta-ketoacyl synthase N-terminal-like domain-containing protein [Maribacter algarum]TMM59288.1 beta-ketoacyl synthase [Maribacter algarum]